MKTNDDKWWKKEPRSRRKCFRCNHLYSSHIDVACMKIIELKPERKGCSCRGFVTDKAAAALANCTASSKFFPSAMEIASPPQNVSPAATVSIVLPALKPAINPL